jgi:hypothetical protein
VVRALTRGIIPVLRALARLCGCREHPQRLRLVENGAAGCAFSAQRIWKMQADARNNAALKQLNVVFENSLGGSANTIKTSPTHVLLVAVVLAVLISGERVRSALRKR